MLEQIGGANDVEADQAEVAMDGSEAEGIKAHICRAFVGTQRHC